MADRCIALLDQLVATAKGKIVEAERIPAVFGGPMAMPRNGGGPRLLILANARLPFAATDIAVQVGPEVCRITLAGAPSFFTNTKTSFSPTVWVRPSVQGMSCGGRRRSDRRPRGDETNVTPQRQTRFALSQPGVPASQIAPAPRDCMAAICNGPSASSATAIDGKSICW